MADFILFGHGQLCHGLALVGYVKQRIIAEAVLAGIEVAQDAVTAPFSRHRPAVRPDEDEGTDVVDRPLFRRKGGQVGNELLVIGFIVAVGPA